MVDRHARIGNDASARFHQNNRGCHTQLRTNFVDQLADGGDVFAVIDRTVLFYIGNRHAAAQIQNVNMDAVLLFDLRHKLQHEDGGIAEGHMVENLGADVAVIALQVDVFLGGCPEDQLLRLPCFDGNTELAVYTAGADLFVGVGVNAGGKPQ